MMITAFRTWSIKARLIALATVPACLMFLLVNGWLYGSGQAQLVNRIAERGELIAQALSEMSQYGVVSGNLDYVGRYVRHLMDGDPSITAIQIVGTDGTVLVSETHGPIAPDATRFEASIGSEVPEIDAFDGGDAPHADLSSETPARFRAGKVSGYVRVAMSPAVMLAQARQWLYLGAAVALLATLVSVAGGLYLARGLGAPLRAVMRALRDIRGGSFEVSLRPRAAGELGELQGAIETMGEALARTHRHLESEVTKRTEELQRALDALNRGNAEKRRLIASSNARLEEERQRISVEIHDQLNASLLVLGLQAQHIARTARQDDSAGAREQIEKVASDMNTTIQAIYGAARSLVKQLRPEVLDMIGLRGALEEMCHNYDELHPQCEFSFEMGADVPVPQGELAITVYRLVQEALSNVVKHSRASRAQVRVAGSGGGLNVSIYDNGVGFDPSTHAGDGIGLIGMHERVASFGGTIAIRSAPSAGTNIEFELPLISSASACDPTDSFTEQEIHP